MLRQLLEVKFVQELLQRDVLFLELAEKLLRVAAGLRTRPGYYMLLDELPLLSEELQSFQKPEVLLFAPSTGFEAVLFEAFWLC